MFWWLYTIIYCKTHFLEKPQITFSPYRFARMVSKNFEISTIEKNNVSAFQSTFERPTTSRSKFIPFWNSKIPLSVSFPRRHHMLVLLDEPWKGLSFCGGVPKILRLPWSIFKCFSIPPPKKKTLFLWCTFSFKIRKFETFEHLQWKIDLL